MGIWDFLCDEVDKINDKLDNYTKTGSFNSSSSSSSSFGIGGLFSNTSTYLPDNNRHLPKGIQDQVDKKIEEVAERISPELGNIVKKTNEFSRDMKDLREGRIPESYKKNKNEQIDRNYKEAKRIAKRANDRYKQCQKSYEQYLDKANKSLDELTAKKIYVDKNQLRRFFNLYKQINNAQGFKDKEFYSVRFNKEMYSYRMEIDKFTRMTIPNQLIQGTLGGIGTFIVEWDSEEKIKEADEFSDSVDSMIKEIYKKQIVLKNIYKCSSELKFALDELSKRFEIYIDRIESIISSKGKYVEYKSFNTEESRNLHECILLVESIGTIMKTKPINDNGDIKISHNVIIGDVEDILNISIRRI